jgi:hypothetical protein
MDTQLRFCMWLLAGSGHLLLGSGLGFDDSEDAALPTFEGKPTRFVTKNYKM